MFKDTSQAGKRRQEQISFRLNEAREALGLTQSEFSGQIGITRDRLASYEDGRTPLRCDVALKACRHFFISEFWLAYGAVNENQLKAGRLARFDDLDARLTMALAIEPIAFSCPFGATFFQWFDPHLRGEYARLLSVQNGFPRVGGLASDGSDYANNAMLCMMAFWRRNIDRANFPAFVASVIESGQKLNLEIKAEEAKGKRERAANPLSR